ncbi:MAG: M16 family metallopeptidase [Candidatus Levyibacteriota bacterium]
MYPYNGDSAGNFFFTGKEYTGYFIKSSSAHLGLSLDILSDIISDSLLDSSEIDRERGVILEEMNMYEDAPARKIGDIFEKLLYGDSPMGWDTLGEKKNIKEITREDFIDYKKTFYSADNMCLVIAGKFDEQEILKKAEQYFGGLPKFQTKGFEKVIEDQASPEVLLKHKKTEQTHFGLGVRTVGLADKKEKYILEVLAAILGRGMSSRLFHELREVRGLAYSVGAYADSSKDVGYLAVFAGVDKNRADEAISVSLDELLKVCTPGEITKEELAKAKEFIKGHFTLDLEDTRSVATHYAGDLILEGKMENPDEVLSQIEAVTLEEVVATARKYIKKDRMNLAVIGEFEDKSRFEKLLG